MTRDEVLALAPGDCLVGFAGIRDDELRVLTCSGIEHTADGKAWRAVTVQFGPRGRITGSVVEDGREIRTTRA